MKKIIPLSLLILTSTTLLSHLHGSAQKPPPDTIKPEKLQRLINAAGGDWTAGETSVSRLTTEEQDRLLGLASDTLKPHSFSQAMTHAAPATLSLPASIDWRDHNGDWTTPIRDQDSCGSCVAFGTLGAVESRLEIYHDNPNENPDLSEQHLFFCGEGDCSDGWYPSSAMNFMRETGAVDEGCDPYDADDHACSLCTDWQDRVTKTHCWYYATGRDNVKYYLANYGPVEATMEIYRDFNFYIGGIYNHTWGSYRGGHAITLVGYDDGGGYWIAKNSWGKDWGEDGWFRTSYGDVINDWAYVPVFDQTPPDPASNVRPKDWNGPYINDATPSFQWDATADDDDGCGLLGYYAAVDDWTPDGEGDKDWLVGNVTQFTIPNPLTEGKHIFAVTAVDVGGNLNPEDTDQPGDAPYYTFYVDTVLPQSQVNPLPDISGISFTVSWSGSDAGSDIASYALQVRDGDAAWEDWKIDIADTQATFSGALGHTYYFRSRAVDQAGNVENWPQTLDARTTVEGFSAFLPLILQEYAPAPPSPSYPDDAYYNDQWAMEKVKAPTGWGLSRGQGALIAIVDTGADLDHVDLVSKIRTDIDRDFINGDNVADDDHGHGTHVSGVAAAETDNKIGIAGLGWEAMLLPLKILDADGYGTETNLAAAIRYAADNGADVINMSLGASGSCPTILQQAADYAYAKGVILAAASGNHGGSNGPNAEMFPANCEHVLGVAAANSNDSIAYYSNYGTHVSVAAPGSNIYSTLRGDKYGNMSGTSMAAPHVAGLAALLIARYPNYTPDQVASAILDNAQDLGENGWDEYYGCGRIDAYQALSIGAQAASPVCLQSMGPWSADAAQAPVSASFVPGEIIFAFQPSAREENISSQYGADAEFLPDIQAWRLRVPPGQEQTILARLQADPIISHAELNYRVSAQ